MEIICALLAKLQQEQHANASLFHMNEVFANCSDEDDIYPQIAEEIAEAQQADASLKHLFKHNSVTDQGLEIKLIENMASSEVQNKMTIMGHQISSCHVPVGRSFFIL
jgi:hypothetical protein